MKKHHKIENIKFESGNLSITIDGQDKMFVLKEISSILENASDEERNSYDISPSGYGIHWPLLDEDISIDGLLGIFHTPSKKKQISQRTI